MNLPKPVVEIIESLNKKGFEAYVVGGCVRDSLMGIEPHDWDITTSASPDRVKAIFPKTFDTGIEHGTVTVVKNKENYQVTTFRLDGDYLDKRHPDRVIFTQDIEQDLMRRDFTMNAIAYHPKTGYLDPFGGQNDIKRKVIRCVLDPERRFDEDALRMLRCLRFSAQLNFSVHKATYTALLNNLEAISAISIERVRDEILKLIMSDNSEKFSLLTETKILKHINEEFFNHCIKYQDEIINHLPNSKKDLIQRLTIVLKKMPVKKAESILKFLRLDNVTIKDTVTLLKHIDFTLSNDAYVLRKLLSQIGKEQVYALLSLRDYSEPMGTLEDTLNFIVDEEHCTSLTQLAINGNDLMNLGIPKGQKVGQILHLLLDEVLRSPCSNNYDTLSKKALELYKN